MDLELAGRRVLLTGGTKGIGRAIAEAFLAEGAHVAFCARNRDEVSAATGDLRGRFPQANVHGSALDVADAAALRAWVDSAREQLGGIDITVANVSALSVGGSEENWRTGFEVDLMGTVRLNEAAMPALERSDVPSIVTVASVSGREIDFASGAYGAFKAAIIHYTQGLAYHLASKRIRANSVSPGNTYFPGGIWNQIESQNPKLFADALALNPMGRMARPEEIAAGVVFLASPKASFISGTNLVVDGSLTRGVQL